MSNEWKICSESLPKFNSVVQVRSPSGCQIGVYFSGSAYTDKETGKIVIPSDCYWCFPKGSMWKQVEEYDEWKDFDWRKF